MGSGPHLEMRWRTRGSSRVVVRYSRLLLSCNRYLGDVHSLQGDPTFQSCTWGHISTVSWVEHPPQTLHTGSHIHSPGRGLLNSASKVSYVNPLQTLHLVSYVHSLHCDTPFHNLHLGSHIHSPPWTVLPRFVHRVTHPHSPGDPTSLTLYCGITATVTKPHRPGTRVLRSTVSMANHSQTLHLR